MSVLSNEDIKRELGINIYIHPLNLDNIRGNTLNLTASEMAWSLSGKESIVKESNGKKVIVIPAHDTALIETEETICVSYKIGGTYHSRVSMVSSGLGHIGTTLDPGWIGPSLIAVHNHLDTEVTFAVGESIASIVFHYLNTESTYKQTNISGQTKVLQKQEIKVSYDELDNLNQEWRNNADKLRDKMISGEQFRRIQTERDKVDLKKRQNKAIFWSYFVPFIFYLLIVSVVRFVEWKLYAPGSDLWLSNKLIDIGLSGFMVVFIFKIGDVFYRRRLKK